MRVQRDRWSAVFLLLAGVLLASCGEGAPPDERGPGALWDGSPRRVRLAGRQQPELVAVGERIVAIGGYLGDETSGRLRSDGVVIDAATGRMTELPDVPFDGEPVVMDAAALDEGRVVVAATVCGERPSVEHTHTSCPEASIETAVLHLDRREWSTLDLPDVPVRREVVADGIFPRVELVSPARGGVLHLLVSDVDAGEVALYRLDADGWAAVPAPSLNARLCAVDGSTLYSMEAKWVGGTPAAPGLDPPDRLTLRRLEGDVWEPTSYADVLGPAEGWTPQFSCDGSGPVLVSVEQGHTVVFQRLPELSRRVAVDLGRPGLPTAAIGSDDGTLTFMALTGDVAWLRPDGTAALVPRLLDRDGIEPSWDGESGLLAVEELSAPVPEGASGDGTATIAYLRLAREP
jgi:hypothetical protein